MFLPSSDKMNGLLNNGLSPISLEIIQECDNTTDPRTFKEYPKFISTSRIGNTLTIDVSVIANCCHNFLGEAEVKGKDTLNLVYTSYGGFCSCECCFTLRYKFDTSMEDIYQVLNYVTINGSKTVGQIVKQALETKQHIRSEEHTSELQSRPHLVCRLLLEKKNKKKQNRIRNKKQK